MQVTVNIGTLQEYALQKLAEDANDARPLDGNGDPVGEELTAETYFQKQVAAMLLDYCRFKCRISGVQWVRRFTPGEWGRILGLIATNQQFAALASPLLEGQRVELAGPLVQNGVAALASVPGLLDSPAQDRAAALLAPPQPGEKVI